MLREGEAPAEPLFGRARLPPSHSSGGRGSRRAILREGEAPAEPPGRRPGWGQRSAYVHATPAGSRLGGSLALPKKALVSQVFEFTSGRECSTARCGPDVPGKRAAVPGDRAEGPGRRPVDSGGSISVIPYPAATSAEPQCWPGSLAHRMPLWCPSSVSQPPEPGPHHDPPRRAVRPFALLHPDGEGRADPVEGAVPAARPADAPEAGPGPNNALITTTRPQDW